MKRKIITTADGSKTIQIEDWNEQYHSIHGATQEAKHVFIKHGLLFLYSTQNEKPHVCHSEQSDESLNTISILEIGFGTGLNALVTLLESEKLHTKINYLGVEAYPISSNEISELNYAENLSVDKNLFSKIHACTWEKPCAITLNFLLTKQQKFFKDISEINTYNLIYFDAFGARVQPELWTEAIFKIMYTALKDNGILVTYSAKGSVRRAMQSVGFTVERLPGPPGKREMLRACKEA